MSVLCTGVSFKGSIARRLFFPEGNHCEPKSTRLIKTVSPLPHKKGKESYSWKLLCTLPGLILKLTGRIVETSALR